MVIDSRALTMIKNELMNLVDVFLVLSPFLPYPFCCLDGVDTALALLIVYRSFVIVLDYYEIKMLWK